jgi:hypothetical protein
MRWLRHAFAVDPPGPAAPTAEQQPAVDWFCRQIAMRRLTTPALIALEMSRPLNFIAAQTMQFFSPGVWAVVRQQTHENYLHFAAFLERRGSVEYLARRIEHFEAEFERLEKAGNGVSPPGPTAQSPSAESPAEGEG